MKKILILAALVMAIAIFDNPNTKPMPLASFVTGIECTETDGTEPVAEAALVPHPANVREDD